VAVFEEGMAVDGRQFCALIEITYAAGTLPADTRDALVSAIAAAMGGPADLSFTVSSHPYSVIAVRARLRGTDPLAAITRLDTALDRSLMTTGLFEEFDVSGRVLRVAPWESAERLYEGPSSPAPNGQG
jgi:hypothetical protein